MSEIRFAHPIRQLTQSVDVNVGPPRPTVFDIAGTGEQLHYYHFAPGPSPQFSRVISLQSTGESDEQSLSAELTRRYANGLQFRVIYTLAKLADTKPSSDSARSGKFRRSQVPVESR